MAFKLHVINNPLLDNQRVVSESEITTTTLTVDIIGDEQSPPSSLTTMSRRESRVSLNVRQNDALNEFENCMYKYSFCSYNLSLSNSPFLSSQEEVLTRQ